MMQRTGTLLFRTMPLLLAFVSTGSFGQNLKERMAEKYASVFDHDKVAAIYEDLHAKGKADADDLRALANTYRKMNDGAGAESAYERLMATGARTPEDVLAYADQLRSNGKYDEAVEWYKQYAEMKPDDQRVQAYLKGTGLFDRLMRDTSSATIRTVPINSPQADLGMSRMGELLLFSSARGEGIGGNKKYVWDDQPFLNLYSALLKGETLEEPLVMRKDINSRYHDGTVAYDSTAKRMYFTRNNVHYGVIEKASGGDLNLGIFFADIVTGEFGQPEWGSLIHFDHNDPDHNVGHPFVTHDGRRIFFVSDMPGGHGGTDIWYSDNLGNQWGAPQNMGPKINTSGDEMYPFMRADSMFYFASTGHPGLGGLDLFYSRLSKKGPGNVFNMGHPMNTRFNDHSLVLIDDSTGFFASDRPGGMGSDDIYGCTVREPMIFIAGIVIDRDTKEPIEGATIVMKDGDKKHVERFQIETEPGGKFKIDVEYRQEYILATSMNGYFQVEKSIVTDQDPLEDLVIELVKYDYAAEGTVMEGEGELPMVDASVTLLKNNDVVLQQLFTDQAGRYQFPLEPETDYRLMVEKEGFFKQSARITTKGKPSAVINTDFRLFPLVVDQVVRLDEIFYDYNKWEIRPDAAAELDKLVTTLQDNPSVKIELSAHTDCRGKDAYNLGLSQKRAKAAVDYIVSKGIARDRVISKGYGETLPSESCKCEECTEEQHQRNRRTEFKVLDK